MNPNLQRALILFEQGRHEAAADELRMVLANEPQNAQAHAILALCLSETKKFEEATREARQAIHLEPDFAFSHYALAHVYSDRNRFPEALNAIREASRLDPEDSDFCALEAQVLINTKKWSEGLAAAERGLEIFSEDVACTNLRAMALVKLGRNEEAGQTIDSALARDPGNAITHANQGWTLLHQGDAKKALHHFSEALRLDPGNEWAQAGIVEALKARNFIYALMLKYFLFMSKLSAGAQWGIIIGAYFFGRVLAGLASSNPELAPWVLPFRVIFVAFVILTWIAYPLFNLLLRFNKFGRMVLAEEQVKESNWIAFFLALAVASLGGCLIVGFNSPWFFALAVFGLILMPLCGTFRCSGGPKKVMITATTFLLLVGITAIVHMVRAYRGNDTWVKEIAEKGTGLFGSFALGILITTVLANILASRTEKK